MNLEPFTVAVTQNFVSSAGLPAVLKFLKPGKKELVSGCCMADRYVRRRVLSVQDAASWQWLICASFNSKTVLFESECLDYHLLHELISLL